MASKLMEQLRTALNEAEGPRAPIARATGVSKSAISRFEAGQPRLTIETAERLADYLGYRITLEPKKKKKKKK